MCEKQVTIDKSSEGINRAEKEFNEIFIKDRVLADLIICVSKKDFKIKLLSEILLAISSNISNTRNDDKYKTEDFIDDCCAYIFNLLMLYCDREYINYQDIFSTINDLEKIQESNIKNNEFALSEMIDLLKHYFNKKKRME